MPRTLLLCFIHGFKGDDDTFRRFPDDLKEQVGKELPDHRVESVIYPKYETKGELAECTSQFLGWLKERVMDIRKAQLEKPWPPNDREVGVILVSHSMGGFVAADTLFLALTERASSDSPTAPLFPCIQGILAFDTPYNGLSRSLFVYGAFSNYQKVSSVFNVMTALSTAPAALSKLAMNRARTGVTSAAASSSGRNPGWKAWQLIAVKTGTVGAIAAGGVAAYVHRKEIMEGLSSVRNLNKQSIVDGYQNSVGALGQGLAYINRGNVGESFAWMSDHFTFVGALMKQTELSRRLERMAALKGVGIRDFYASLGENGVWSGGYFVPERTFSAVPQEGQPAAPLFDRWVVKKAEDEVQAHMGLFQPQRNTEYDVMTKEATKLVIKWFNSEEEVFDDPKFLEAAEPEPAEEAAIKATDDGVRIEGAEKLPEAAEATEDDQELPDESPIDIAAAASLVPLPEDDGSLAEIPPEELEKATYMRHLFGVAQQAGTGIKRMGEWSYQLPAKMPKIDGLPRAGLPSLPVLPKPTIPSMPNMPSMNIFSRKQASSLSEDSKDEGQVAETTESAEKVEEVKASEAKTTEEKTDSGISAEQGTEAPSVSEKTES